MQALIDALSQHPALALGALAAAQATANHAPAKWRVNGPLANFPAFGQAFACKGRVAMQKPAKEQVSLWR